ncbi:hypothetical protein bcgnr5372_37460 [Bacillus luti]|nr:hypothetical protein [Bacillus cereus]HDR8330028.1 hypothetical protein [Bacillus cereus]HDR8337250.1 hypothetical protein [Bacillus cereus]
MIWNHGTTETKAENILKNGYKFQSEEHGMWGRGIYLSSKPEDAYNYGNTILQTQIPMDNIVSLQYKDIVHIIQELLVDEEAGDPYLETYITEVMGKDAVAITYEDGITHLVVYKPESIPCESITLKNM